MFKKALLAAVCGCAVLGGQQALADAPVNGYYRANGAFVAPHLPTRPDRGIRKYPNVSGRPRILPSYYQSNPPAYTPRISYPVNAINAQGRPR